ncbi:GNAT family N-acetyltransferase [Streptomyces sp. NBC_01190]|uniref:GNAT family N-acetyltransferase n=1 Tax=Streptomyces sp. NBC_01190 TaxID=2903767 RepID=UPI003866832C|nr:GNAT family N-acetyltransferase [Streptomyces sp. NBC_01190]
MPDDTRIRHVADTDWEAIVALEAAAYEPLGLSEERTVLESRVRASPDTCFVLFFEERLAGYLLALPYPMFAYPDLTRTEETVFRSDNLHLHDLVVAEDLRGRGLGRSLLHRLAASAGASGYERISLVAVGGSDVFWAANGFVARPEAVRAGSYGTDSVYMSRPVRAVRAGQPEPTSARSRGSSSQHEEG